MWWSQCFPPASVGYAGSDYTLLTRGCAQGLHAHNQNSVTIETKWERCRCQGGVRVVAETDGRDTQEHTDGSAKPEAILTHTIRAPHHHHHQSHTTLPPANIHHPVMAWWIVGEHWTEMIPLNSSYSSRCLTTNGTHGNGLQCWEQAPPFKPLCNLLPRLSVWVPHNPQE